MADLDTLGLNRFLYKENVVSTPSELSFPGGVRGFETLAESITSGEIDGNIDLLGGFIQSKRFVSGSSGWRIEANGDVEFNSGTFRGSLVAGSIDIPDTTTANSFHVDSSGNSWWGAVLLANATASVLNTGVATFTQIIVGQKTIVLESGDSISDALSSLSSTGGTILLKAGTYTITSSLTGVSSIQIIGENKATTIIDFNSTAAILSFAGSSAYSTGTITSIAGGVNVTGSGTSWLANVTTNHQFFIAGKWYKIAAVTGDTTLVLSEGYAGGATFPGSAYRTAILKVDIEIKEVTIKNSTGNALDFDDCRDIVIEDVEGISNNVGLTMDYCSEVTGTRVLVVSSTGNGVVLTQCGFANMDSFSTPGNGGHGVVMNNCRVLRFDRSSSTANTSDGYNVTSCSNLLFDVQASSNGGQGVEMVSGNSGIIMGNCLIESNTSDGIKLTATSDDVLISSACIIKSNGGYGVNIAASTNDNTIIVGNTFASNSSGAVSDSGTGTLIKSNSGVADSLSGSGSTTVIVKPTTETVNNSSTLQNDNDFTFSAEASQKYAIDIFAVIVSDSTADFKWAVDIPTSATMLAGAQWEQNGTIGNGLGGYTTADVTGVSMNINTGDTRVLHIQIGLINGANAGAVTFQWSQDTTTVVDTQVLAGSYMRITKQ